MKITNLFLVVFMATVLSCCSEPMEPGEGGGEFSTQPRISIGNTTQFEGDTNNDFEFEVRLSEASDEMVSVDFATDPNTAIEGFDFVAHEGKLEFAPSETSKIIRVEIVADTLKEEDEQFSVQLTNPVNATLVGEGEGIGTIRNEDEFVFIPEDGYITPEFYGGYNLVWADEFNGTELDPGSWTYELGAGGWGNQELQTYTNSEENSFVANGKLVIEARENTSGEYSSARIVTVDKKEFMFGRIDIRAKLPYGQGIWPALWMLGANFPEEGWPNCGEIDIMELVGHEASKVHGTAHWGPAGQTFSNNHGDSIDLNGETYADQFHVFSIVWDFNKVKWYMDDTLYFSIDQNTVGNNAYPFNQDFFFIFNIAVGGQWPGNPDQTTTFPQRMVVDYIRVFQPE